MVPEGLPLLLTPHKHQRSAGSGKNNKRSPEGCKLVDYEHTRSIKECVHPSGLRVFHHYHPALR